MTDRSTRPRVVIVGAGIGGLSAAVDLCRAGAEVLILERTAAPGGKMRAVDVGGSAIDAGPTVLTMRWVFDELFSAAGAAFEEHVGLVALEVLARHAWPDGSRLDLFSDRERSRSAIAAFAGEGEADGFMRFCRYAEQLYELTEQPFIRAARPSLASLARHFGWRDLPAIWRFDVGRTVWTALGEFFQDLRLRQLFARYATYVGGSPFHTAATLNLVAHVEQLGVWRVRGGMRSLARALADLAVRAGAELRCDTEVSEVEVSARRACGVKLAGGARVSADAVLFNGDVGAIGSGRLGRAARHAVPRIGPRERSLSAITWCAKAHVAGFPLTHHNVFFSSDYAAEFRQLVERRAVPEKPTTYICAQDRALEADAPVPGGQGERLLCLINAPARGDEQPFGDEEVRRCESAMLASLEACGLKLELDAEQTAVTTPAGFERLFPGSGGALYGRAPHGWSSTLRRPSARSALRGLYLCGGSTHPGPGVPMVALSGRAAARAIAEDL